MSEMIRLTGVSKSFGAVRAVDQADLSVAAGEFLALLGPSGCGKSTLLRLIAGFESSDQGTVALGGRLVSGEGVWVSPERRRVGIVFQDYALFPHLNVRGNVGFGLPRSQRDRGVRKSLELVGLAGEQDRFPHELSGGQQQRVALARALAPRPSVVLLDEPWSNIDPLLRVAMRDELAAILRDAGVTVVLVTHDREEAFSVAARIALMHSGRVVQTGAAEDLYYAPVSRWAAEFVGAANMLPGCLEGNLVRTAIGSFERSGTGAERVVDALVRPELLELRPDPSGRGRVVQREFRGHDVFYRVLLEDGTLLCAQRPSTEAVELGSRVSVRAHRGPVALFRAEAG
jgi:iron(III) transport system ATP-binding protein